VDSLTRSRECSTAAARERVSGCDCESGCPSCVGPVDANEGWGGDPKSAVAALLSAWIGSGG